MEPTPATPSRSPSVRGWCPGVHIPLESGDGWLVRTRTGCRTVTAPQWRALGGAAHEFGNGLVELTSRGNVQLRGVQEPTLGEVAARLIASGVVPASPASERARCVVSSPLAGCAAASPTAGADSVVSEIESLLEDRRFRSMPAKWWAVVDDGGAWPLAGLPCDVRVRAVAGNDWAVEVAGSLLGLTPDPGGIVIDVARWSSRTGRRAHEVDGGTWRRRLRIAGAVPPEPDRSPWLGARTVGSTEVVVAAPFLGTCTADDLHLLADLIEAHHVVARPTTERSLALSGGPDGAAAACRAALERAGWIVEPGDSRAALSACIGRRGCGASLADTEAAARRLALAGVVERTHLSGCSKACGAPSRARHLVATGPCSFEVAS